MVSLNLYGDENLPLKCSWMMTHWYVLYTKPNKEKKVLTQLEKIGIKAYYPMTNSI